jgi:folate-dependent phosphoribosylglycinamide formyltransferase PurN
MQNSVLLITADQRRHRFVAGELARAGLLGAIVSEEKAAAASGDPQASPVIACHLEQRDRAEAELLSGGEQFPDVERLAVHAGEVNGAAVWAWLEQRDPEWVVLYGTGVIRDPLLSRFAGRMINLHLGLSPYYRGAATNFWPLVNGEPECVGATLHLVAPKVDAGPVLAQVRPEMSAADGAHEIGTKALMAGARLLPAVVRGYAAGHLSGGAQDLSIGRVYRMRDFHAGAVEQLWRNLAAGMVPEYLADRKRRTASYPIWEWLPGQPESSQEARLCAG